MLRDAIIDTIQSLHGLKEEEWFSSAVFSTSNPYGIAEGLIFSFPCINTGPGAFKYKENLPWEDFLKEKIALTEKELLEERDLIAGFLR